MSRPRLLIVFSGADVTGRLNTLACDTGERRRQRKRHRARSLRARSHLQTQEKVTRSAEPMRVLKIPVKGGACRVDN